MPILNKNNQKEIERYIAFTSHFRNAHFYQDYRWSNIKKNLQNEYVYLEENGEITAACSIYVRPIAFGLTILYAQRGPVCEITSPDIVLRLIEEMKPLVKKYHAFMIKFDPNIPDDKKLVEQFKQAGFFIRGEGYSKLDLILSRRSMVVPIEKMTIEELMPTFSKHTRRNIRIASRSNLEILEGGTKENLDIFMEILKVTAERDHIEYKPREFFEDMLSSFTHDEVRLYLIKNEDDYLSAAFGVNYGGRMMYYHSGSSNVKRKLYPNYLMQCVLMDWACKTGCHVYDMGGIIKEDNEDGLYMFKHGFTQDAPMDEYIGELDYPIHTIIYHGFNVAYAIVQRLRRWWYSRNL